MAEQGSATSSKQVVEVRQRRTDDGGYTFCLEPESRRILAAWPDSSTPPASISVKGDVNDSCESSHGRCVRSLGELLLPRDEVSLGLRVTDEHGAVVYELLDRGRGIETMQDLRCGQPVLSFTRIAVADIERLHREGASASEIREAFPSLSQDAVEGAIEYAALHSHEIGPWLDLDADTRTDSTSRG